MLRVGWVASRFYPQSAGGAEQTDYALMEQGRKLGHLIDNVSRIPPEGKYDFLVLSNYHDWIQSKVIEIIMTHPFALRGRYERSELPSKTVPH